MEIDYSWSWPVGWWCVEGVAGELLLSYDFTGFCLGVEVQPRYRQVELLFGFVMIRVHWHG